jgi:hypothetical protein
MGFETRKGPACPLKTAVVAVLYTTFNEMPGYCLELSPLSRTALGAIKSRTEESACGLTTLGSGDSWDIRGD